MSLHFLLSGCAISLACSVSSAATILKLDLGSNGSDFELIEETFSTVDDGTASPGQQNTTVVFTSFLDGYPDIPIEAASFSLEDVILNGSATAIPGSVVIQPTQGGTFGVWDDSDELLLAGTFNDGAIVGSTGDSATGSFANLSLGTVNDGSLASLVDVNSVALSISFTNVTDGQGFSLSQGHLAPFSAEGTANMSANQVPEPATIGLIVLASLLLLTTQRLRFF